MYLEYSIDKPGKRGFICGAWAERTKWPVSYSYVYNSVVAFLPHLADEMENELLVEICEPCRAKFLVAIDPLSLRITSRRVAKAIVKTVNEATEAVVSK